MKRASILTLLIAGGALSIALAAQPPTAPGGRGQQQGPRAVQIEKLRDNLFVLRGGGGNTAVFVTAEGVVVVDTKLPGWGQPIIDRIRELTDKPVTMIINTHTHGDHVSGNVEFPASVDIAAHENTRANMDRMQSPPGMGPAQPPAQTIFEANDGKGLPKRTFKDRLTLGSGPDRVDLYYFGRGHTNGDALVVFPALQTMHAGDLFPGKSPPIIDTNNGGSGVEYPDTLTKLHEGVPNVTAVITGHSTVMTWNDLKEFAEFNRDFLNAVREAKKSGRSVEEFAAGWTSPAKYTGYTGTKPERLRANVQAIYNEIQ